MWIEDLTPCTYIGVDIRSLAVGWLEPGKSYATGAVDRAVYEALIELRKNPWQPFSSPGGHECGLCQFEGPVGSTNLFIPSEGRIYIAPELVVHYINAHRYAPPEEFCRAVLACPPMRSRAYLRALKDAGGTELIRPGSNRV